MIRRAKWFVVMGLVLAGGLLALAVWMQPERIEETEELEARIEPSIEAVAENEVLIYFSNTNETDDCQVVFPVSRLVSGEVDPEIVMEKLLDGPTSEEVVLGYASNIPPEVELLGWQRNEERVTIELSPELKTAAGSCRVLAIREQIEQSLKEIEGVEEVEIEVEGTSEGVLEP